MDGGGTLPSRGEILKPAGAGVSSPRLELPGLIAFNPTRSQPVNPDEPLARLSQLQADLAERERVGRRLDAATRELAAIRSRLSVLRKQLVKEGVDVARLGRLSLHSLFYTVLGSKKEQLQKERQEHLAARLAHESAAQEKRALEAEIAELEARIAHLDDVRGRYGDFASANETGGVAGELIELSERRGKLEDSLREIEEALQAGVAARGSLRSVLRSLSSAGAWGVWDMLGGGLLVTAMKHSKIDDARRQAHGASSRLGRFRRELEDVRTSTDLDVGVGGFETFADYFFDGLIFDWVVQSRIHDSERRVKHALAAVNGLLAGLRRKHASAQADLEIVRTALARRSEAQGT